MTRYAVIRGWFGFSATSQRASGWQIVLYEHPKIALLRHAEINGYR